MIFSCLVKNHIHQIGNRLISGHIFVEIKKYNLYLLLYLINLIILNFI
jgi:hypothetical protein